jgi:hypothetical protein
VVAAATLFWTLLLAVDVLGIAITQPLCVGLLAVVSIVAQLVNQLVESKRSTDTQSASLGALLDRCGIATAWLGTVWLAALVARGLHADQFAWGAFDLEWPAVVAATMTAVAHATGVARKHLAGREATDSVVGLATATTLALIAFVVAMPTVPAVPVVLCMATVAMFASLGLAAVVAGPLRNAAVRAAEVVAWLLVVLVLPVLLTTYAASLVVLFALLAAGYVAVSILRPTYFAVTATVALAVVACWQAVAFYELGVYLPLAAVTAAGLAVVARRSARFGRWQRRWRTAGRKSFAGGRSRRVAADVGCGSNRGGTRGRMDVDPRPWSTSTVVDFALWLCDEFGDAQRSVAAIGSAAHRDDHHAGGLHSAGCGTRHLAQPQGSRRRFR